MEALCGRELQRKPAEFEIQWCPTVCWSPVQFDTGTGCVYCSAKWICCFGVCWKHVFSCFSASTSQFCFPEILWSISRWWFQTVIFNFHLWIIRLAIWLIFFSKWAQPSILILISMVSVSRRRLQSPQAHMLDKESFSSASAAVDALNRGCCWSKMIQVYSWPCLEMNLAFQCWSIDWRKWCRPGHLKIPDDFVVVFSGSSGGWVEWGKDWNCFVDRP